MGTLSMICALTSTWGGAGFGHLIAGTFLTQNRKGSGASCPYFFMTYQF